MRLKKALLALIVVAGCAGKDKVPVAPVVDSAAAPVSDSSHENQQLEAIEEQEAQGADGTPLDSSPIQETEDGPQSSEEPEPVTTLSLCEPIGKRWKYPKGDQRKEIRTLIKKTCRAMGVGAEDCRFFLNVVSIRESGYRPWVRHKLAGDVALALSSYIGTSQRYGWIVRWDPKARKQEDISKFEFKARGEEQNQYYKDPERWMFGLGLGGLNIPYHLIKFDRMAPPEILCDTVINIMVQVTIARNAVDRYGADNFAEIQAIYGGRKYFDRRGRSHPLSCTRGCPKNVDEGERRRARRGDASILKRCRGAGIDCLKKPQLGNKLRLRNMTKEERYRAAEEIRGAPLPPFDIPKDSELKPGVEG